MDPRYQWVVHRAMADDPCQQAFALGSKVRQESARPELQQLDVQPGNGVVRGSRHFSFYSHCENETVMVFFGQSGQPRVTLHPGNIDQNEARSRTPAQREAQSTCAIWMGALLQHHVR